MSNVHELIVQQTCEAIIYSDLAGIIRIWNKGAETLFGFPASEALGVSLDLIIPERFRAAHWSAYHKAIEAGRTYHAGQIRTTRATHKDGRKLYVDMSFDIIKSDIGAVLGSMAVARDATARHLELAALRKSAMR